MKISKTTAIVLFNHLFILSNSQTSYLDMFVGPFNVLKKVINHVHEQELKDQVFYKEIVKMGRIQKIIPKSVPFPCSTIEGRSKERPTNINRLRPGDIDIIGAIGDSITAGYALTATSVVNSLHENRGMVYSIGGQSNWREFITLPNILKEYNPKLIGFSLGTSLTVERRSQFNVAENGAVSYNMPYMTKVLIKRIIKDPRANITHDWKMITILMGGNDFCSEICYLPNPKDAVKNHKEDLLISLRLLRDSLPRTFVNLVLPPDVAILTSFTRPPVSCYFLQRIACPCFVGEQFKDKKEILQDVIAQFQNIELEISDYEEFHTNDFTVVAHSFLSGIHELPKTSNGDTDRSYFSVDCFHFTQKTHSLLAVAFWNSIWIPVGKKSLIFNISSLNYDLMCPTEEMLYMFTKQNSIKQ